MSYNGTCIDEAMRAGSYDEYYSSKGEWWIMKGHFCLNP